jgi:hypothetical protein
MIVSDNAPSHSSPALLTRAKAARDMPHIDRLSRRRVARKDGAFVEPEVESSHRAGLLT